MGIYFLETGASVRPSKVVYDRAHSAIAEAVPSDFDFEKIFEGAIYEPTVTEETTFTVEGEDAKTCGGSTTVTVYPLAYPTISDLHDEAICLGASVTFAPALTADDATFAYRWMASDDNLAPTYEVKPNAAGVMPISFRGSAVYVKDNKRYECASDVIVRVTAYALPEVTYEGITEVCKNVPLDITAHGADTYEWKRGNQLITGDNNDKLEITPDESYEYTLTGTENHQFSYTVGSATQEKNVACHTTITVPTTVFELPTVSVLGDKQICHGDIAKLSATGAKDYKWFKGDEEEVISATAEFSPKVEETQTYRVIGTNANNCTHEVSFEVVPLARPELATEDSKVCLGSSVELTAPATADPGSYVWTISGVKLAASDHIALVEPADYGNSYGTKVVKLSASKIYTVDGQNDQICSSNTTFSLVVNNLPSVSIEGDLTICPNAPLDLEAKGSSVSYKWTGYATTAAEVSGDMHEKLHINNVVTDSKIYEVTGTDANGCQNKASVTVVMTETPTITVAGDFRVCKGNSTKLTASGASSFKWIRLDENGAEVETVHTGKSYELTVDKQESFKVVGTDNNDCQGSTVVTVYPLAYPEISLVETSLLCVGEDVTLSASAVAANSSSIDYEWPVAKVNGPTLIVKSQGEGTITNEVKATAHYDLTSNTCSSTATAKVVSFKLPTLTTSGVSKVCFGTPLDLTAAGADTYKWSGEFNVEDAHLAETPTMSRDYTLQGTKVYTYENMQKSCSNSIIVPITVYSLPDVMITGDRNVCKDAEATLKAEGALNYAWYNSTTSNLEPISQNPRISPKITEDMKVTLVGTDANGCKNDIEITIKAVDRPVITAEDATICLGKTAKLTASATGGSSYHYQWTEPNGTLIEETASISVSPKTSQNYKVEVIATYDGIATTCASTKTVSVTVNNLPEIEFEGSTVVCQNDALNLEAKGAVDYTWDNVKGEGDHGEFFREVPTTSVTYVLKGTDANGCENSINVPVTVNPLPDVQITGDLNVCGGSETTLTANNANTYVWSTNETSNSIKVTVDEVKTISVVGTDLNKCKNTAEVTVNPYAHPDFTVRDTAICYGSSVTLSIADQASDYAYYWVVDNDTTYSSTITISPAQTTTVYVHGREESTSCITRKSVKVTVYNLPTIAAEGSKTICFGDNFDLKAKGADTYVWHSNLGEVTGDAYTEALKSSQTITLEGTENHAFGTATIGCKNTLPVDVVVNPLPVISIEGDVKACVGDAVSVTAKGANTYKWFDGTETATITKKITEDAEFTVVGTDNNGCQGRGSVQVYTLVPPTITADDAAICLGETASLSVSATAPDGIKYSYYWTATGETDQTITVKPAAATANYPVYVNATASYNGTQTTCTSQKEIKVEVYALPEVAYDGKTTICQGDELQLKALNADSYTWNGNAGQGDNQDMLIEVPTNSQSYKLVGTQNHTFNGKNIACKATISVPVTVNELPTVSITGTASVCDGTPTTLTAHGANSYLWSLSSDKETILSKASKLEVNVSETLEYYVIGTDVNGCKNDAKITVSPYSYPTFEVDPVTLCFGDQATMTIKNPSESMAYVWTTGDTTVTGQTFIFSPATSLNVYVKGTSSMTGCEKNEVVKVTVNPLPIIKHDVITHGCIGDDVKIIASGATSYKWNGVDGDAEMIYTPIALTSSYNIVGTDDNNCSSSETVTVTLNKLPDVQIAGELYVCENTEANLTATGAQSYAWSTGETGTASIKPVVTDEHVITVTGTDNNQCENKATVTLHAVDVPELTLEPATVCFGTSADMAVLVSAEKVQSYEYLWSNGTTTQTASILPNAIGENSVSVAVTANYVGSEGTVSCQNTAYSTVTAIKAPTLTITGALSICSGETLELTAGGAQTYTWNGAAGEGDNGEILKDSPKSSAPAYKLIGTDAYGCSSDTTIVAKVYDLPKLTISGDPRVCVDDHASLLASGATYYEWNDGKTNTAEFTPLITDTTTYTVTGYIVMAENNKMCQNSADIKVYALQKPTIDIIGNTEACYGKSLDFTATANANDAISYSYEWTDGTADQSGNVNLTVTSNQVLGVTATAHYASTDNACKATKNINVISNPLPVLSVAGKTKICQGDQLDLLAQGASTYEWLNVKAGADLQTKPMGSVTYTLVGTDAKGCISSLSVPVTVDTLPVIKVVGNRNICNGSSVSLTAQGAEYYTWLHDNSVSPTMSAVITQDESFKVEGVDGNNCKSSLTVDVKVIENPTVEISGLDEVCVNGSVKLTASGAQNYKWSTGEKTASITVTPDAVGTLTLSVEGTTGNCTSSATHKITVHGLPQILVGGETEICAGDLLKLTATGAGDAGTYKWNTGMVGDELLANPSVSGTYTVTGTDAHQCQNTTNVHVTVNPLPQFTVKGNRNVCDGTQTELTAVGSDDMTYVWNDGNQDITYSPAITPIVDKPWTYKVTGTDAKGCKNTLPVEVAPIAYPIVTITGEPSTCLGGTVTLTASTNGGNATYVWHNGMRGSTMTFTPEVDIQVYVNATENGCTTKETKMVTVNPLPTLDVQGVSEICEGGKINLTAYGALNYTWNGKAGLGQGGNVWEDTPTSSTIYKLRGEDALGCVSYMDVPAVVHAKPAVKITGENVVCEGTTTLLTAGGDVASYIWNDPEMTKGASITPKVDVATSYTVTATSGYGCINTASIDVTPVPYPEITVRGAEPVCSGTPVTLWVEGVDAQVWQDGSVKPFYSFTPEASTTVYVNGTSYIQGNPDRGCTTKKIINVEVHQLPIISFEGDSTICHGNQFSLIAKGAQTYTWSNGATGDVLTGSPTTATTYKVYGRDALGCEGSKEVTVRLFDVPSIKIKGDASVCINEAASLLATGSCINYKWVDGPAVALYEPIVSEETTYEVVGTDANGCTNKASITVTPVDKPVITTEGNPFACVGNDVTLTALGAKSYVWELDETDEVLSKATTVVVKMDQPKTLKLTGYRDNCSSTITVPLTVNQPPVISVLGNTSICQGDILSLTATGAVTYDWSNGVHNETMTSQPMTSTSYKVDATDANGCQASLVVPVEVYSRPTIGIAGPNSVCKGGQVTLSANGSSTMYEWVDPELPTDTFVGAQYTYTINEQTVFTVFGTDDRGCKNKATMSVTPIAYPVISIIGDSIGCINSNGVLVAQGANEYLWSDETRGSKMEVLFDNNKMISVSGTKNGCTTKKEVNIRVNPLPVLAVKSGNTSICKGDRVELTVEGADSYSWSNGTSNTTGEFVASPLISTTYSVTGTDANKCKNTLSIDVTVNELPKVVITGDAQVCEGSQASFTASSESQIVDYVWNTGASGAQTQAVVNSTTVFVVDATDVNGCQSKQSFTVKTIPYPDVKILGNPTICVGDELNLVAQGAVSYKWSNGTASSTLSTWPTAGGTYSVSGTTNGCTSTATVDVVVRSLPNVLVTGKTALCMGEQLNLRAEGAETYTWGDGTAGDALVATPLTSSTYKVTGTDQYGCKASNNVDVTVYQNPVVNVSGDDKVCSGQEATLVASGNSILYVWDYNGVSGSTISPIVTEKTTYTVTGTDNRGCTSKASFTVTPINAPKLAVLGRTEVCLGETVTLVGQGASSYEWVLGNQTVSNSAVYTVTPQHDIALFLSGATQVCKSDTQVNVHVILPPNVVVYGDKEVCPNEAFVLTAQGASSYRWSTGDITSSITYAPISSSTYFVTGYDEFGCSTTVEYPVDVKPVPMLDIDISNKMGCLGTPDEVKVSVKGGVFYTWTSIPSLPELGEGSHEDSLTLLIDEPTKLTVVGKGENGCEASTSVSVDMLPRQPFLFEVNPHLIDANNPTVLFKGTSPLNADWSWTPAIGLNEIRGNDLRYEYDTESIGDSVVVTIRATDTNGCEYVGYDTVFVWRTFWAPTAFTPNNDGKNETFKFYGGNFIDEFEFVLYDRLGQIVYEGHSFDDEWDGTYKGKPCPTGVYGWYVKYKGECAGAIRDGEHRGYVTILK